MRASTICVIGGGYVGIPTAAILSLRGHQVVLAENNELRLAALQQGNIPIFEPGLEALVEQAITAGTLSFSKSAAEAVKDCEYVFLCVPTPQDDDGSADLSYVMEAVHEIRAQLKPGCVVVNKSTVPVGTALLVEREISRADVKVASNPEFLREGSAVEDSLKPDRIVVGSNDTHTAKMVAELFANPGSATVITDCVTAESIKYAANAFLATKISFINEAAAFCDAVGADMRDLVLGMGFDRRIGFEVMQPGPGWGGSCFPKDTRALVKIGEDHGYDFSLVRGAIESNKNQFQRVVDKIEALVGDFKGVTVAIWGLTFKANTDDRGSSPAIPVIATLLARGALVRAYDPTVQPSDESSDLAGITISGSAEEAATGAEVLVILTEWTEFRWMNLSNIAPLMGKTNIVDTRNMLDPEAAKRDGFTYLGMGRS